MLVPEMVKNAVSRACRLMCKDINRATVTKQISIGILGFAESF